MGTKQNGSRYQDDLFKSKAPKMPEGYYSGDKPNPNLRAFVEQHLKERPYNPATDNYDVPAFDKPIETTKATAIYNMHTYHQGKKPHDAIRQYIRHYTRVGDLVLDPFCGSGSTALAALMEGRKAIAIDRSPAATFISKNYCTPVDPSELQQAFEDLKTRVEPDISWLYETRCDRCGGKARTAHTVYSQVFQCPRCLEKVPLFDCVDAQGQTASGKPKKIRVCPHCYDKGYLEEIRSTGDQFGAVPVLVSYVCENGCTPARGERHHLDANRVARDYFSKYDLAKIEEIRTREIPFAYPDADLAKAIPYRMLFKKDFRPTSATRLVDLFTKRNLWALSAVREGLRNCTLADTLLFGFEAILVNLSRMQGNTSDERFPNNIMRGTYYLPQIMREYAVLPWYQGKIRNLTDGYRKLSSQYDHYRSVLVSTQSACNLGAVANDSVDHVFTDPPYGDSVQYGELNFVWESWLEIGTDWHDDEIIVSPVRGKSEADWARMMRLAMSECYRVLKPGRWLSLCYHDTSEGTWALVQDILAEAGFLVDTTKSALFIDTKEKSFNQLNADKVTKRDLVINFRKPRLGEAGPEVTITGDEDARTFREKVHAVVRDYLVGNPGSTKDHIYDELVSRMVRAGQMEAHNFDELLAQVAEPVQEPIHKNLFEKEPPNFFGTHEVVRWYLKETEEAAVDAAESAKEDAAAASVGRFIAKQVADRPWQQGVHYSDIFEHFVYAVKDKPRRPLADWLLDYFYKTEDGTYRLPATEAEREAKAVVRAKGTSRQIKRYLSYLQEGVPVPAKERPNDATLAEWIRQCKRAGLYEQGKLLYEKGGLSLDGLSEEMQVGVEEDYQVCVRMLARGGGEKEPGKPRGAKVRGDRLL